MAAASEQSEVAAASGAQRLRGRVALITGAGGAIGAAIAKLFAKHGAKVAVADLSEEGGAQTVREIAAAGGVASFTRVNVAEEKEVSAWIDAVARQWGTVDVLVNNAAAFVFGTVEEATSEMWDQVLSVNVKAYALCAKHALRYMKAQRRGSIVNISSISAMIAQPAFAPYNTSKGAVLQLTRCIALDHGPDGVRCNAVCPGTIDTPATSKHAAKLGLTKAQLTEIVVQDHFIKRLGHVDEVAFAALFLASDESSFTTGSTLMVDGGYTAH